MLDRIALRLRYEIRRAWRHRRVLGDVATIKEADRPAADSGPVVICLVRDGMEWLETFIEHHLAIGVSHIVFVDNGSTDGTVEFASRYPQVSIVRFTLPVRHYELEMRRYAANRFGGNRWCLCVDIDELFDFPGRDSIGLAGLIDYLEEHGYDAVVGQMLDFFRGEQTAPSGIVSRYRYYDVENIEAYPYTDERIQFHYHLASNRLANDAVKILYGGIRKSLFDVDCCLTKHPLVFNHRGVRLFTHPHCSSGVTCADISVLIRHYKMTDTFFDKIRDHVESGTWAHGEFEAYLEAEKGGISSFRRPTSREYRSIDDLVDAGFLVVSPDFRNWLQTHQRSSVNKHDRQ